MGGYGSGQRYRKKATVEECRVLDCSLLVKEGITRNALVLGHQWWGRTYEERTVTVSFTFTNFGTGLPTLRIDTLTDRHGNRKEIGEPIPLTTTRPRFGGVRWWFICPLVVNGVPCQRRARKLYLPPGTEYFGCRTCYNLTYESTQTYDKRVGYLLRNPHALLQALKSPPNWRVAMLGLKAAFKAHGYL